MILSKLSKRERFLLALLAILILVVFGHSYIYQPLRAELKSLAAAVEETKELLAQQSQLVAGDRDLEEEYRRREENYRELLMLLPDNKDLPALLLELERALQSRDVALLAFEPLEEERVGTLALSPLRLGLRGSFGDIAAFPEELATFPRLIRAVELNLYGDKDGDVVRADLYLEAYYLPADGDNNEVTWGRY